MNQSTRELMMKRVLITAVKTSQIARTRQARRKRRTVRNPKRRRNKASSNLARLKCRRARVTKV